MANVQKEAVPRVEPRAAAAAVAHYEALHRRRLWARLGKERPARPAQQCMLGTSHTPTPPTHLFLSISAFLKSMNTSETAIMDLQNKLILRAQHG